MTWAKNPLDRSSDRQHGHANESKRDIIDGLQHTQERAGDAMCGAWQF